MMAEETIYTDAALVALYDALNPAGADADFYRRMAAPRSRILDIGCGTGLLTRLLAADGHRVTGIEPAAAMLTVARRNDAENRVTWIEADARTLALDRRFDMAIMTGHVFQVFSPQDAGAVLRVAHEHLDAGGRLIFESRNPAARAWERWTPEASRRGVAIDGIGTIAMHHRLVLVEDGAVTFETVHAFPHDRQTRISRSTLWFPTKTAIDDLLKAAGFADIAFFGGWSDEPFADDGAEIIVVARA